MLLSHLVQRSLDDGVEAAEDLVTLPVSLLASPGAVMSLVAAATFHERWPMQRRSLATGVACLGLQLVLLAFGVEVGEMEESGKDMASQASDFDFRQRLRGVLLEKVGIVAFGDCFGQSNFSKLRWITLTLVIEGVQGRVHHERCHVAHEDGLVAEAKLLKHVVVAV